MPNSTIERQWNAHGLDCAVLRITGSYMGHCCGYVRVPDGHPWHGVEYDEPAPDDPIDNSEFSVDDVGVINAFCYGASDDEKRAEYDRHPEYQVRVHGGLTYSGDLHGAGVPEGWWFGFDCAHGEDSPAYWTVERVAEETERMAEQIAAVAGAGRV